MLLYYEEEIEGETFFAALADHLTAPEHKAKMAMLAEIEGYTAKAMQPLLEKYALKPRATDMLHANGRRQAEDLPRDWPGLINHMRETFPAYITAFERLEAMAPPEDLPALRVATAHEIAAVSFLEREAEGDPDSIAPLREFLKTGTA